MCLIVRFHIKCGKSSALRPVTEHIKFLSYLFLFTQKMTFITANMLFSNKTTYIDKTLQDILDVFCYLILSVKTLFVNLLVHKYGQQMGKLLMAPCCNPFASVDSRNLKRWKGFQTTASKMQLMNFGW